MIGNKIYFMGSVPYSDYAFGIPTKPTKLQTINNARKKGANVTGNFLGGIMGGTGATNILRGGGTLKGKITRAVLAGTGGAILGKTTGGLVGGTVGTGVGVGKALLRPKKKTKLF